MRYETVIGLEIHAELATESKIYCSCSTAFGAEPNTQTCPICTGMPGVLPVLNKKVVEYAVKAGLAMNCDITEYGKQDRKNYFYPDLPKAYQTSQYDEPICRNGYLDIDIDGGVRRIGITRIHIEEDAGKLIHDPIHGTSLIDYNRCGVPLIEIVTEPDMRSPEEAKAFLESVKAILEYTGISDCKMQEGSLRCDVNLSLRPEGQERFGTRTEMKNINSFRAAVRAMESEILRQKELLEDGKEVVQSTRRWDDEKGMSYEMRSKEDSQDYRYFPEPDLVPIVISQEWVESIRSTLPELPAERRKRYTAELGLSDYDAAYLTSSKKLSDFFEDVIRFDVPAKSAANQLIGDIQRILRERNIETIPFAPQRLAEVIRLTENGTISSSAAKKVVEVLFEKDDDPKEIAKKLGLLQLNDVTALQGIVEKVLWENPRAVKEYQSGKEKAFGFLVGQVMRLSKGSGNPKLITEILKSALCGGEQK